MVQEQEIGQEYQVDINYKVVVRRIFKERQISHILDKVNKVMDSMAEPFDHNKAYFEMLNSDFDSMSAYIKDASDRQLVADIKNVFGVWVSATNQIDK